MAGPDNRGVASKPLRNLSPIDALAATFVIDRTIFALIDTAPIAFEALDAADPFERRMRLSSPWFSPYMRFTTEE